MLGEAFRKGENREEWRKVVARSSLVPQRSTRPREKWIEVTFLVHMSDIIMELCNQKYLSGRLAILRGNNFNNGYYAQTFLAMFFSYLLRLQASLTSTI